MPDLQIFHENCIETLDRLPNDSVALTVTSPPYNMNLRMKYGKYIHKSGWDLREDKTKKYEDLFNDDLPIDEYNAFHTQVLDELIRVSGIVFYNIGIVTGSKRSVFKMIGDFSEYLKDIIIWDKGHGQPAIQEHVLNRRTELILVFEKDYPISRQFRNRGRFDRGTLDDLWLIKRERSKSKKHGAVFPEELVETILTNFSDERELVYDPFMGTGTTAVVAKRMKRRFLGSETCKEFIDTAIERLEA